MIFRAPYLIAGSISLALHFHPDHWADLKKSGLSDKTIQQASVFSLTPGFIRQFFSLKGQSRHLPKIETALCFPYQGGDSARIKLFPSIGKWKYAQPPGTSARLYVPFPVGDGPIYVCEGEKKTLAAHQVGLNAVGIGGVWSWLSKHKPIDDLSLIDWQGRDALIIPDSDVFERPDLLRAIYAFGRELRDQGAYVRVAQIPHGEEKVGLDDFLSANGNVEELETFSLDQRVFKSAQRWFGQWKVNSVLRAA